MDYMGLETIKTADLAGQSPWALRLRLNASPVFGAQRRWGGICGLRRYVSEPLTYVLLIHPQSTQLRHSLESANSFVLCPIMFTDNDRAECKWTEWSDWSNCSGGCDARQRTRTRQCTSQTTCPGDAVNVENCLRKGCPSEYWSVNCCCSFIGVISSYATITNRDETKIRPCALSDQLSVPQWNKMIKRHSYLEA